MIIEILWLLSWPILIAVSFVLISRALKLFEKQVN
jgi:hypothetical protein